MEERRIKWEIRRRTGAVRGRRVTVLKKVEEGHQFPHNDILIRIQFIKRQGDKHNLFEFIVSRLLAWC